jgi:hypothetical protein
LHGAVHQRNPQSDGGQLVMVILHNGKGIS